VPTATPTRSPTTAPTSAPTRSPTTSPTAAPTGSPTSAPTPPPTPCTPSINARQSEITSHIFNNITITGPAVGSGDELRVANAGDFNGDGIADILIGAPNSTSNTGIVYIVFGNATLTSISLPSTTTAQVLRIVQNISNAGAFGTSVSTAGDFNNDGFSDIIVGSPAHGHTQGMAYVFFGKNHTVADINVATLTTAQGIQIISYINSTSENSILGQSVSNVGDFNNDTIADVAVGDPEFVFSFASGGISGAAYILFGSASPINIFIQNFTSAQGMRVFYNDPTSFQHLLGIVTWIGDFNGDKIDDIGITSLIGGSNEGFVIYGVNKNASDIALLSNFNTTRGIKLSNSGPQISGPGDFNNDGLNDLFIRYVDLTTTRIVFGNTNSTSLNLASLTGTQGISIICNSSGAQAVAIAGIGDFNGDVIPDVAILCTIPDSTHPTTYIAFGSSQLSSPINLENIASNATLGTSTSSLNTTVYLASTNFLSDCVSAMLLGGVDLASNNGTVVVVY